MISEIIRIEDQDRWELEASVDDDVIVLDISDRPISGQAATHASVALDPDELSRLVKLFIRNGWITL